ncbi:LAME_0E11408g1_1 [Lachancea meyersii CBS 8951]|uniref:LAME_0E11408g1_1 n=1 Tax=Lachancea meyersii CBS 8951 TaxID=1266667 RepID=A0A1G4JKY1_9SACH|nr:LAME_0E11408g1_1 [Lachancea meyersii CBS 8951]
MASKQVGGQPLQSEDFSEIECPPQYRVTPSPEQQDEWNNVNPLPRRRSTNYSDALEMEHNLSAAVSKGLHVEKGSDSNPTQHHQSHKRGLQQKAAKLNEEETSYEYGNIKFENRDIPVITASHGFDRGQFHPQESPPRETPYGIVYFDGKDQDQEQDQCLPSVQRPPLNERRSSLFEDYKKDMYDKQHMFEG